MKANKHIQRPHVTYEVHRGFDWFNGRIIVHKCSKCGKEFKSRPSPAQKCDK